MEPIFANVDEISRGLSCCNIPAIVKKNPLTFLKCAILMACPGAVSETFFWKQFFWNFTWHPWKKSVKGISSEAADCKPPGLPKLNSFIGITRSWELFFENRQNYPDFGAKKALIVFIFELNFLFKQLTSTCTHLIWKLFKVVGEK